VEAFKNKDIKILIITRVIRNFYFGYLTFILPLYLRYVGFSYVEVGLYALVATVSSSILVIISGFFGDLYGRKKMLIIMSSLSIYLFIILILTKNPIYLFLSSIFGISFSGIGGGAGGGPIAPLINALVAERVSDERTMVYSTLTSLGTFSSVAGGIFSAIISSELANFYMILFIVGLLLAIISTIITFFMENLHKKMEEKKILPLKSGKNIMLISMAGMFGSLGLGIVLPLISLWFQAMGLKTYQISTVFTVSYIVAGIAVNFASYFEKALGTIKSIVTFRFLGSVLLAVIPFLPLALAIIIYILRTMFYQMALPIRQNFSMNIFSPDERSRGSSITGFLFSIGMFSLAFLSAGLISTIDPILYYLFFKNTEKN
jgi:MFS family permease